jgi:hypothetical protein
MCEHSRNARPGGKISTLIDSWYRQATVDEPGSASSTSPGHPRTRRSQPAASLRVPDELDRWLLEPAEQPGKLPDVIAYWRAKSGSYPQLSIMALDVLSILPTSCEAERIFSRHLECRVSSALPSHYAYVKFAVSAKLLVNDRRMRLKEDIIEASECVRHWQLEGLVKWNEDPGITEATRASCLFSYWVAACSRGANRTVTCDKQPGDAGLFSGDRPRARPAFASARKSHSPPGRWVGLLGTLGPTPLGPGMS